MEVDKERYAWKEKKERGDRVRRELEAQGDDAQRNVQEYKQEEY